MTHLGHLQSWPQPLQHALLQRELACGEKQLQGFSWGLKKGLGNAKP